MNYYFHLHKYWTGWDQCGQRCAQAVCSVFASLALSVSIIRLWLIVSDMDYSWYKKKRGDELFVEKLFNLRSDGDLTFSSAVIRITLISVVSGYNWLMNHQVGSEHAPLCGFVCLDRCARPIFFAFSTFLSCGMCAVALWADNTSSKKLKTIWCVSSKSELQ